MIDYTLYAAYVGGLIIGINIGYWFRPLFRRAVGST